MKFRLNYVSNSSSASYIIPDFSKLPHEKITALIEYDIGALKAWEEHGLKYEADGTGSIFLSLFGIGSPLDFGIVNAYEKWFFKSEDNGACKVYTMLDNFNMAAWLEYNGVEYEVEYESKTMLCK